MAAKKPVTLKTLADRAGCSIAAVSTVLNGARGTTGVGEDMRRRIESIARRLGYRANAGARMMKTRRSGVVGVLVKAEGMSASAESGTFEFIEGIGDQLERRGRVMSLVRVPDAAEGRPLEARALQDHYLDGAIVVSAFPTAMQQMVTRAVETVVWLDTNVREDARCIRRDERAAGRTAVTQLARSGYERIVYVTRPRPPYGHFSFADRFGGARSAAKKLGLDLVRIESPWPSSGAEASLDDVYASVIERGDARTAILAGTASVAAEVVSLAATTHLRLGTDLGLACCETTAPLKRLMPMLAHVTFDRRAMGRAAADMLVESLLHPRAACPSQSIVAGWSAGASAPDVGQTAENRR